MDTDSRFPYSLIPPPRNFRCRFYGQCLDAQVAAESSGFVCYRCEHYREHEDIPVDEGTRCLQLLVQIYGPSRVATVVRDMVEAGPEVERENGRFVQLLKQEAA